MTSLSASHSRFRVAAQVSLLSLCVGLATMLAPQASGAATSSSSSSVVASAKNFLKPYEAIPKGVGITIPVKKTPSPNQTVVYLQCEQPQCASVGQQYAAAVSALHWNLKILNYQSTNPATFTSALTEALQYHPVAVGFLALLPYALWSDEVASYKAANVAMLPIAAVDTTVHSAIVRNVLSTPAADLYAKILADWVIADSNGHAKVIYWSIPQLPAGLVIQSGFLASIKPCTTCSVKVISSSIPDVEAGDAPGEIVSAVKADPGVKYVVLSDIQLAPGLTAALKAAGVTGVKIAANEAAELDQTAIRNGEEAAGTPSPNDVAAWQSVDAAVRFSEGMSVPAVTTPTQLLTKATMTATGVVPSDNYPYPSNYQKLFKQLWKMG